MKRREIIEAAKKMIFHHGIANLQEFGEEIFQNNMPNDDVRYVHREEILTEIDRQAKMIFRNWGWQ